MEFPRLSQARHHLVDRHARPAVHSQAIDYLVVTHRYADQGMPLPRFGRDDNSHRVGYFNLFPLENLLGGHFGTFRLLRRRSFFFLASGSRFRRILLGRAIFARLHLGRAIFARLRLGCAVFAHLLSPFSSYRGCSYGHHIDFDARQLCRHGDVHAPASKKYSCLCGGYRHCVFFGFLVIYYFLNVLPRGRT